MALAAYVDHVADASVNMTTKELSLSKEFTSGKEI